MAFDPIQGLSPQQVSFLESEGYLVLEKFASKDECEKLIRRMEELVNDFDPCTISIFSTSDEMQKSSLDAYFWDSASNISFFFEANAFDELAKLKQPKALSINKVGHAIHDLDPVFREFSYSDTVKSLLVSLGYRQPGLIQSMYIFKQPGIGGEVVPHQDATFLYTDPPSCIGLWIALEDANIENGCLWVLPQSHKGQKPGQISGVSNSRHSMRSMILYV
eukprot:TRINITY_DN10443_c0_g1_i2.p1 TRINITY_DN10443_c0_g1~~TRINITY_DN10443_c0_g1_i2.p1  ORF type:complete len:220 (+),score=33.86 TRINITY_DN10443_c0_g1_i2:217-876(+)